MAHGRRRRKCLHVWRRRTAGDDDSVASTRDRPPWPLQGCTGSRSRDPQSRWPADGGGARVVNGRARIAGRCSRQSRCSSTRKTTGRTFRIAAPDHRWGFSAGLAVHASSADSDPRAIGVQRRCGDGSAPGDPGAARLGRRRRSAGHRGSRGHMAAARFSSARCCQPSPSSSCRSPTCCRPGPAASLWSSRRAGRGTTTTRRHRDRVR